MSKGHFSEARTAGGRATISPSLDLGFLLSCRVWRSHTGRRSRGCHPSPAQAQVEGNLFLIHKIVWATLKGKATVQWKHLGATLSGKRVESTDTKASVNF